MEATIAQAVNTKADDWAKEQYLKAKGNGETFDVEAGAVGYLTGFVEAMAFCRQVYSRSAANSE